jgi:AraC-like DNA-binding protein
VPASKRSVRGDGGKVDGPSREHTSLIVVKALADAMRTVPGTQRVVDRFTRMTSRSGFDLFATIPRRDVLAGLVEARQLSGKLDLGLTLGELLTESSFHALGPMIMTSATGRQAIKAFLSIQGPVFGGPSWEFRNEGEDVRLGFMHDPVLGVGARIEAEIQLTLAFQTSARFSGARVARLSIGTEFGFPAPQHAGAYRAVFGDRLSFGGRWNCLRMPPALLDAPRPGVSAELSEAWQRFAEQQLLPPEDESWSERCMRSLRAARQLADVDFEKLAGSWSISLRTLRRRLEAEQTSLSTLLERARLERARELLANPIISVGDIAAELGYLEVTSFHRAFKRWAGVTPGAFRRKASASSREG